MEIRTKAVVFYEEGIRSAKEIGETHNLSERTVRRWAKAIVMIRKMDYDQKRPGRNGLPVRYPIRWNNELSDSKRNIRHGAAVVSSTSLIYRVPGEPFIEFSRNTVFLFKSKRNPNPPGNDSNVVMLTACGRAIHSSFVSVELARSTSPVFTEDCSRYRVKSKVYLHKDTASSVNALHWALRAGRIPREIYLDNGKLFVSKIFKAEAQKHDIKLIFGRPYNPRGRGKIELYHKTLYQELIALKEFHSLSHFKREFWNFD